MSMLNRTLKPNISRTSKGRYRVRLTRKGKLYENYTTKLKDAIAWRDNIKSKCS